MELNFNLAQVTSTAEQFLAIAKDYPVIAIHGEMGAGKTTFVHALCDVWGVKDTVSSPTFSIINQYKTKDDRIIYHIDLYRLKDIQEAIDAGVEDCLHSGHACLVEWPERAPVIFPDKTLHILLTVVDSNTRKLKINL